MIMGILRIKVQKVRRKVTNRKKYNLRKLEDSDCQRTVKVKLREGASSIRCKVPEDIEEKWERIKNAFQDICESTLGPENSAKKEWISDST
jgi:predicted Holliday junction resolvase-like endonuclease